MDTVDSVKQYQLQTRKYSYKNAKPTKMQDRHAKHILALNSSS